MEIQRYNKLTVVIERAQRGVRFKSAECEQTRRFCPTASRGKSTQFKIIMVEKERTGTWFSELMGHNFFTSEG